MKQKKNWENYLSNFNLTNANSAESDPDTQSIAKLNSEPPSFKSLINFMEAQINMLESIEEGAFNSELTSNLSNQDKFIKSNVNTQAAKVFRNQIQQVDKNQPQKIECILCKGNYFFSQCANYKSKTIEKRIDFVKAQRRCFNCLGMHFIDKCSSKRKCNVCNKKHHTSLHLVNNAHNSRVANVDNENFESSNVGVVQDSTSLVVDSNISSNTCGLPSQVLLSTAVVKLVNNDCS